MKKSKLSTKGIAAIVCCVLFVVFCFLGVKGIINTAGKDAVSARDGVVWVYAMAYDTSGNSAGGSGTGWAVGKKGADVQYIVTNGHVVQTAYEYPKLDSSISGEIRVYFSAAENDYVIPQVVYYSPQDQKDIAILKLPTATNKRRALPLRDSDTVDAGETMYALGYPGISSARQDYVSFDQSDITVTQGIISKRTTVDGTAYEAFQMDVSINGGNSGGPLVDSKGNVVGINTLSAIEYVSDSSYVNLGMNYAIIINELTRILDNERIPYYMAGEGKWMIFVFLPLALISLLGAILLFVSGKKKAVVSGGSQAAITPAGRGPGRGGKPILRGVSGKFAGQSFDLTAGRLVLGRDPAQCNLVFDANTPGVSGNHCQIAFNATEDVFILTDNGSSYGTFLGDGRKLTASVPEKVALGDSFYLGNTANRFVVTRE